MSSTDIPALILRLPKLLWPVVGMVLIPDSVPQGDIIQASNCLFLGGSALYMDHSCKMYRSMTGSEFLFSSQSSEGKHGLWQNKYSLIFIASVREKENCYAHVPVPVLRRMLCIEIIFDFYNLFCPGCGGVPKHQD